MKKTTIGGIVTLIILLSSGTTWYVQDLGTKTGCRGGWDYIASEAYEGYYGCTTLSGIRYETCFEVYDSGNTENYWCKKGVKVEIEKEIKVSSNQPVKGDYICSKRPDSCKEVTI